MLKFVFTEIGVPNARLILISITSKFHRKIYARTIIMMVRCRSRFADVKGVFSGSEPYPARHVQT